MTVTLVPAAGALLRARPPEAGLVRLETLEPHRVRTWRVVRLGQLRFHVEAWCSERGIEPPAELPW